MNIPDKNEFAQLVITRLQEAGVIGEITYDPEKFMISEAGEKQSILFLHNAYQEYCSLPQEDRPQSLRQYVRAWIQAHKSAPEEYADIQSDILPAVRSRSFFESARLRMIVDGNEDTYLQYQTLGDDLGLGLVYDMPDSMRPISNKEIDLWGVTFYEALESARDNLRQLHPMIVGPEEGEGIYIFTTNDGYDCSRLIILDLIRQFQVKGDYIAMVPGREMLIVAGSEDTPGLEAMIALAKKSFEQPRAVSGTALRLVGDGWESWMPEADHPLYDEFRKIHMQSMGQNYAEQKDLLDTLNKQTGEDLFVASFSAMEHKDTGNLRSYCVWSKNTISLLPVAERIVLGGPDQAPFMAPWEKVVEIAGDLMTPMGIYPERYRVDGFPSADQLAAMGNELEAK
ncbi:MAG: DUF1444 family protein [Planctomycetota bacterium]